MGVSIGAVALGFDKAVESAANYQQILQQLHANSLLTSADMNAVDASIKSMSQEGGVGFDALATSFRHAADEGFSLADSQKIVEVAMQASVGTGSNLAETTQELAQALHVMGASGDDASAFMNTLLTASKNANVSFEQFVAGSQQAVAQAAALGVGLADVSAVYATLTRNGQNYALSGTEIIRMMQQIVAPTKAAETELLKLSRSTGVDLVSDFTSAGLASRGLVGIFQDLNAAGVQGDEVYRIFGNRMISGRAAAVILHDGLGDLLSIQKANNEAFSGQATPVQDAFREALGNTAQQAEIAKQKLAVLGVTIGTEFLPPVTALIEQLGNLANLTSKVFEITIKLNNEIPGGGGLGSLIGDVLNPGDVVAEAISPALGAIKDKIFSTLSDPAWVDSVKKGFADAWNSGDLGAFINEHGFDSFKAKIAATLGDPAWVASIKKAFADAWNSGDLGALITNTGGDAGDILKQADPKKGVEDFFGKVKSALAAGMPEIGTYLSDIGVKAFENAGADGGKAYAKAALSEVELGLKALQTGLPKAGGTPKIGAYEPTEAEVKQLEQLDKELSLARIHNKMDEAAGIQAAIDIINAGNGSQAQHEINQGQINQAVTDQNIQNSDAAAKASTSLAKTVDSNAATISKDYDEMAKASGTYKDHTTEDWQSIRDSSIQSAAQQLAAIQGYQTQIDGLQQKSTATMNAEARKQLDAQIAGLTEKRDAEQKSYDQSIAKANEANTAIESSWKSQLSAWNDLQQTKITMANLAYDQIVGKNNTVTAQLSSGDQGILAAARTRYANMLALEEQWQQHLLSDLAAGDSAAVQADQNMLTYLKTGFVDPAKKEFDDLTQKAAAWANLPTPQMHNLTVQIDEAKVHSDELTASFAKANEPVIEASNDWTAVKAKIEEARLPAEQYLAVLQQQASAIQDQITYSQDLLAVQGQTGKTDAWLMQLQIARDQLQIAQQTAQSWGQATPALDKQLQLIGAAIGAEQARNQLAQDQTNLGNVGLQQQDAANKLAQDGAKIQLDGSAGALLNANQHIQASQAALTTAKAIQTVETQADDFHTKQLQSQLQILNDQKKVVVDMAAAAQGATAFPGLGGSGGTPNKISIPDYLPKPADAAAAAKPVGDAIVQGIAQGITQSIPAVQEAARAAVDAAILAARAEGQISSPSKRAAMEIGLPIAQGAALGVTSGASLVQDAMGSLMNMGPGGSAGWGGGGGSPAGESSGGGGTSIGHLLHVENMSVRNDSDITTLVQKISQAQYAVTQGRDTSLGYAQRNI